MKGTILELKKGDFSDLGKIFRIREKTVGSSREFYIEEYEVSKIGRNYVYFLNPQKTYLSDDRYEYQSQCVECKWDAREWRSESPSSNYYWDRESAIAECQKRTLIRKISTKTDIEILLNKLPISTINQIYSDLNHSPTSR